MGSAVQITFLTIAQNEEKKIAKCLESSRGLGRHVVIDGGSTDRTVAIAQELGAEVLERPYDYSAAQYNFGLEQIGSGWVFVLDADEYLGDDLRAVIASLDPAEGVSAYAVGRRNYVWGLELKHGGWAPDWNVRLMDAASVRYQDREVHARLLTKGVVGKVKGRMHHATYDSVAHYLTKLNKFTDREVLARSHSGVAGERSTVLRELWLKSPGRPLTKFLRQYILKAGFLDGRLGFDMAMLSAFYEYVVGVKQRYTPDNPAR